MKYNVFIITHGMGKTYIARNVSLSRCEQATNDLRAYYNDKATSEELEDLYLFNWEVA